MCKLDHVRTNLKREQMLEERYSEIDRENRILLQKMADIMRQPGFSVPKGKDARGPISLNKDYRRQELIRITHENQAILKRIQKAQPVYNHINWEKDHKQSSMYMRNACEYPVILKKRDMRDGKASVGPGADRRLEQGIETDREPSPSDEMSGGTRYVLKEGKKIGGNYYLVEMTTDGRTLTIAAYDGDNQKTLELLVNEKNHRRLYRECNRDYSLIAQYLAIDGDKLMLTGMSNSASAPGDKQWNADELVKESKGGRNGSFSGKGNKLPKQIDSKGSTQGSNSVKVDFDVTSEGQANVHIQGTTPGTQSIHSGYT